jgi:hypothetical protein
MRHRAAVSLIVNPPEFSNHPLFRSWEVALIAVLQTGQPFTPRLDFDNSNTGNSGGVFGYDRPNLIGHTELPDPEPERFFRTEAFQTPGPHTFGDSGRNILNGPDFVSVDLALTRRIFLDANERHQLHLRIEAFNLFNRTNLMLPEAFLGRATFGQVLSAWHAREIQLMVRFAF